MEEKKNQGPNERGDKLDLSCGGGAIGTFSYGIWRSSRTTAWAPMFLSSLCCCFLLFLPDSPSWTHSLLSRSRIWWRTEGVCVRAFV